MLAQDVVKTDISVETPIPSHESTKMVAERSVEQRNLQPAAYKNADGSRRAAGRIITSVEYDASLEVELQKVCDGIFPLMDESLILSANM